MIPQCIKVGVVVACVGSVVNICIAYTSFAQQSQLQQQIKPFECIYTTTQTGEGSNMDSTCEDQPVPQLTNVDVNSGRPLLRGTFSAAQSLMLRVWINGQWYTHGVDPRLTVADDDWQLDFSELPIPLQAGVYVVMVEVETGGGLLLRNTNAGSFIVPVVPLSSPQVPQRLPHNPLIPGFFTPTTSPRNQEGTQAPSTVQMPQPPVTPPDHTRNHSGQPKDDIRQIIIVTVAFILIAGGGWTIRRYWRH